MRPLHRPWEGMLSAAPRFEVLAMDGKVADADPGWMRVPNCDPAAISRVVGPSRSIGAVCDIFPRVPFRGQPSAERVHCVAGLAMMDQGGESPAVSPKSPPSPRHPAGRVCPQFIRRRTGHAARGGHASCATLRDRDTRWPRFWWGPWIYIFTPSTGLCGRWFGSLGDCSLPLL